jgi:hypothetical protein
MIEAEPRSLRPRDVARERDSMLDAAKLARRLLQRINRLDSSAVLAIERNGLPGAGGLLLAESRPVLGCVESLRLGLSDFAKRASERAPRARARSRPAAVWPAIVADALAGHWHRAGLSFACGTRDEKAWPRVVEFVFTRLQLPRWRREARRVAARSRR